MVKAKAKDEPPVPAKPPTVAEAAEVAMRQKLSNDPPPVSYKTGKMKPNVKLTPLWKRLRASGDCSIGAVVPDPSLKPAAALEQRYTYAQKFGIFNPCVSFHAVSGMHKLWHAAGHVSFGTTAVHNKASSTS